MSRWQTLMRHPITQWVMFVTGVLLILVSPLTAPIPGPGAIFIFAAGLTLVLRTSLMAKRHYVRFKRWQPRVGHYADRGLRRPSAKRRAAIAKARAEGKPGGAD